MQCGLPAIWPAPTTFLSACIAPDKAITLPPGWKEMFGMGSKPSPNPNDYPPPEEVLRVMRDRRKAVLEVFDSLSEADLAQATAERRAGLLQGHGGRVRADGLARRVAHGSSEHRPPRPWPRAVDGWRRVEHAVRDL